MDDPEPRAAGSISVVLCPERGIAGMAHSSAARAGMGALTRTLAMEWGRHGIALNCVAPGWIDTEGVRGYGLDLDEVAAQVPMKRLGSAAEVGDLIAYLASPAAGVHHRPDDRDRRRRRPDEQRLGAAAAAEWPARRTLMPVAASRLDRRADRPACRARVPGRPRPGGGLRLPGAHEAVVPRGRGGGRQDGERSARRASPGPSLIRLQCYEGIDATQALYEWDYARQLLYIRPLEARRRSTPRAAAGALRPEFLSAPAAPGARARRPPRCC